MKQRYELGPEDAGWLLFQAAGILLVHLGAPMVYWAVFAALEAAGLILTWPYTHTVRGFLDRREYGAGGVWRDATVVGWATWFVATWWLYSPLPVEWAGPIGVVFGVWVVAHLLGDRW